MEYIVFCNNVYTGTPFSDCICRAGYMTRDIDDSGQIWEPKTVQSAFVVDGDSTFAYLFGIDLKTNDLIWLNIIFDSMETVAGRTDIQVITDYFNAAQVFSVADLFNMMATEIVDNPKDADVVVTDETVEIKEGAELIRSLDYERIMAYMNI